MNGKINRTAVRFFQKSIPILVIALLFLSGASLPALAEGVPKNGVSEVLSWYLNAFTKEESMGLLCTDDVHGANDQPGQKDLTRMCVDSGVDPLQIQFNWDEILGGGSNTYDACNMFDTDSDGNINYSLCVTVLADPTSDIMEYYRITLYSCGDDKPDRCTQPVLEIPPSAGTTCSTSQQYLDPFPAGAAYPQDTVGDCDIVRSDVGGEDTVFVNTCSFPSQQPNSDPSDCITEPGSGFLTIVKEANPDLSSVGFAFTINDGSADLYNPTIYGSGVSDRFALLEGTYSVTEIVPPDWDITNMSCVESRRGTVGTPNYDLDGVFDITLLTSDEITCTFEDLLQVTPSISTTPEPGSALVDDILHDSAELSDGINPSGTITFKLFDPNDPICAGDPAYSEIVLVSDNGVYNTITGHKANMAGTWRWVAEYSGDNHNTPVSSGCDQEQVPVSKHETTTVTDPDPDSGIVGDVLNDTAIVTSTHTLTGEVTFRLFEPGDTTCETPVFTETVDLKTENTEMVTLENAKAGTTSGFASNMVGIWNWTAEYSGDYANAPSSDECGDEQVVIIKDTPSITTAPDPETGKIFTTLHDYAEVVDGYNPSGSVTFNLYKPGDTSCESPVHTEIVDLVEGSAKTVDGFVSNQAGVWRWTADYSGDDNNNPVSSGCDDEPVTIDMFRLYMPIAKVDHVEPWCRIVVKQISPSSYTVRAKLDWEYAAPPNIAPDYHRIKWGDNKHTNFSGESGEAIFYHTYGLSGWYEVIVMLWGTDGAKYFPCGQWVDPPPP